VRPLLIASRVSQHDRRSACAVAAYLHIKLIYTALRIYAFNPPSPECYVFRKWRDTAFRWISQIARACTSATSSTILPRVFEMGVFATRGVC